MPTLPLGAPPRIARALRYLILPPLLACGMAWSATPLQLWEMIDEGRAAEAYQVAERELPDGSSDRDLILGVAAVEKGQYEEAVERLRRHLAAFPAHRQNPRAQLELGRAYYRLQRLSEAQAEFEGVLKMQPPADVADSIRQTLDLIARERDALKPQLAGFVDLGLGYDSNINSGVQDPDVNLPIFGEVRLGQASVKTGAYVAALTAGVDFNRALDRETGVFASARVDSRFHDSHSDLDQFNVSLTGGAAKSIDNKLLRGSLGLTNTRLDWNLYRNTYTATAELIRPLDARTSLGGFFQAGIYNYSGGNRARDAYLWSTGLALSRAFEGDLKPLLRLSANFAVENNRRDHEELGRNLPALRMGLDLQPAEQWTLSAGLTWQQARHRGVGELNTRRKDEYVALDLGAACKVDARWSLSADLQYARNTSNLELYEYDRTAVMFHVRRDFR